MYSLRKNTQNCLQKMRESAVEAWLEVLPGICLEKMRTSSVRIIEIHSDFVSEYRDVYERL
jgi:hypothetical protein